MKDDHDSDPKLYRQLSLLLRVSCILYIYAITSIAIIIFDDDNPWKLGHRIDMVLATFASFGGVIYILWSAKVLLSRPSTNRLLAFIMAFLSISMMVSAMWELGG